MEKHYYVGRTKRAPAAAAIAPYSGVSYAAADLGKFFFFSKSVPR